MAVAAPINIRNAMLASSCAPSFSRLARQHDSLHGIVLPNLKPGVLQDAGKQQSSARELLNKSMGWGFGGRAIRMPIANH